MLVAVIDIGKTNKKVVLYDRDLRVVSSVQESFSAEPGPDGILHEPVEAIWNWLRTTLGAVYRRTPFHALAITTHGATQACLTADGELALPVIAYDHALTDAEQDRLDQRFTALTGHDLDALQRDTGTCDLPLLINPAKNLLFARQHYPSGMAQTAAVVNYPQFWGHRLTGRLAAEPTYAFNHSYFYDFDSGVPSRAAEAVGVAERIPTRFAQPWDRLGTVSGRNQVDIGLPPLPVVVGIHDSNAALLPYLVAYHGQDFVLNTTGTWCVAMHAVAEYGYRDDELGRKILFNRDALGGLQKVSFLMGGQEYACYHDLIGGEHATFDAALVDEVLADTQAMILPGAFPSQFPGCQGGATDGERTWTLAELQAGDRPDWFADAQRAQARLNVSLALQTVVALEATGIGPQTTVCIEGGFRNNSTYCHVLAALMPERRVACTSFDQATSAGAALLGHAHLAGTSPLAFGDRLAVEEQPIVAPELANLVAYRTAFMARVSD